MTMLCLCITLLMSIASVTSDQNINTSHIRVFPGTNQSVAGVFQVSFINQHNKPEYVYNASEARQLCSSLGVKLASKSEVRTALSRGFETCRYGWIDEHFAVIPRIKALSNCGQNQTGLLTWRTSVTETFDVFCFNESDAAIQLRDTTTDSSSRYSTQTLLSLSSSTSPPSSSSTPETSESEEKSALFVGRAQGSSGGMRVFFFLTGSIINKLKNIFHVTFFCTADVFMNCMFCFRKGYSHHHNLCPFPDCSSHPGILKTVSEFPYKKTTQNKTV
uniref:Lymphatic vessel endothelial hyaluronan receptor 1 n=1 Tax=Labrus bergylta TaxID=56723 RepID=A0A3Q3GQ48_9LABR